MKYLAVLGRQPEISIAEIEALVSDVRQVSDGLAIFTDKVDIDRLGGTQKLAEKLEKKPLEFLQNLPEGKITLGVSDYSKKASRQTATAEALKLKKILVRHGRSVRVVANKDAVLSTATSLHNGLSGKNERKVELIKTDDGWYMVIGVQDIDAYARRDQARPARDAKVGMLPPKLAQILINLCGSLKPDARILDPFCGTGVVLQEALLMGYRVYGTDISERMIEYSKKNIDWLNEKYKLPGTGVARIRRHEARALRVQKNVSQGTSGRNLRSVPENNISSFSQGDATNFQWQSPIDAVACEGYLGKPFSKIPSEIELKEQKQECGSIVLGFLKNLAGQIEKDTPVVIAVPAWLRSDGTYERLDFLDHSRSSSEAKRSFASETTQSGQLFPEEKVDEIKKLGYNVNNKSQKGLLYHREGQVVARDVIILRKK